MSSLVRDLTEFTLDARKVVDAGVPGITDASGVGGKESERSLNANDGIGRRRG